MKHFTPGYFDIPGPLQVQSSVSRNHHLIINKGLMRVYKTDYIQQRMMNSAE